jgi:hypothetical protein
MPGRTRSTASGEGDVRGMPLVISEWTLDQPGLNPAGQRQVTAQAARSWNGWPVVSEKVDDDGTERVRRFAAAWRWLLAAKHLQLDRAGLGRLAYGRVLVPARAARGSSRTRRPPLPLAPAPPRGEPGHVDS